MKNLKILLAEDDPLTSLTIVSCLSAEGYEINSVANGKDALEELEYNPGKYDILITDLDMPVLSGSDLIKKLKLFRFSIEIAVITGCLTHKVKEDLSSYKIKNIFIKPISFDEIFNYLEGFKKPDNQSVQNQTGIPLF